ncbi:MAG: hypothetical protein V2A73_12910 [Pseudomonadota bacterium]
MSGSACSTATICGGQCSLGECVGGTPVNCADDDPCTADGCNPDTRQCLHSPLPDGSDCNDKNPATWDDVCTDGRCKGVAVEPDAGQGQAGGDGGIGIDDTGDETGGCGCRMATGTGQPTLLGIGVVAALLVLIGQSTRRRCRRQRIRTAAGGKEAKGRGETAS